MTLHSIKKLAAPLLITVASMNALGQGEGKMTKSGAGVPIAYDVDVAIVGGSSAAVAAAVSAAESGASVFLAAPRPYLGEDLCATYRLWLENDETPESDLAKAVFASPTISTIPLNPNALPFTYEASLPSADKHRDTRKPSLLTDGRWHSASQQSVQYDGDVSIVADLGARKEIGAVSAIGEIGKKHHDAMAIRPSLNHAMAPWARATSTSGLPARETTEFTGNRLEKGPAFGKVERTRSKPEDWPTFRGGPARSGSSKTHVVWNFDTVWKTLLQGKLTQPVIAEGKVFVASIDAHTIHALDEGSGMELWSCTAGGRVHSSPTVHKGHVIFGSRDGYVYSLRASDGELVWRFLAARDDRRIISYDQPESVWPVHGNVLIMNGTLYFAAGRNAFLDGGLVIYRLKPETGVMLSERDICMLGGDGRQPSSLRLQMDAAMPDILSSDGERGSPDQYRRMTAAFSCAVKWTVTTLFLSMTISI